MAKFLVPPGHRPVTIAPSVLSIGDDNPANGAHSPGTRVKATVPDEYAVETSSSNFYALCSPGIAEVGNPTVLPSPLLENFQWVFLIRPPEDSVPSYYRLTFEPYSSLNGMYYLLPNDVSYSELRAMFDYLCSINTVGSTESEPNHVGSGRKANIYIIDSDDLVDRPADVIKRFCEHVGIEYLPSMLDFTEMEGSGHAAQNLKHWGNAFHEEAMTSTKLLPRGLVSIKYHTLT